MTRSHGHGHALSLTIINITTTIVIIIATMAPSFIYAYLGVDVSQNVSPSSFQCLSNNGRHFVVIRAYCSDGSLDSKAPTTIANAHAGGMKYVDVYMFPCPQCGNPEGQVTAMINNLRGSSYGMVWLDIEGSQYWTSDVGYNRNFFTGLLNQARAMGAHVGVYTSRSQWSPIMGDWAGGSSAPLWYAHYDGSASFSDFVPFGGWGKPSIKQYQGTTSFCGASVDLNWYPDGLRINRTFDA